MPRIPLERSGGPEEDNSCDPCGRGTDLWGRTGGTSCGRMGATCGVPVGNENRGSVKEGGLNG